MFDIKWIRENPEVFDRSLARRGQGPESAGLLALDDARRTAVRAMNQAQERQNAASKKIGAAKAQKDEAKASQLLAEVAELKAGVQAREAEAKAAEEALDAAMAVLPNLLRDDVPDGADETANVERGRHGEPGKFDFPPNEHFELGEALGMMDFDTATKMSGARFVVLRGPLARLERALGQFMLDVHVNEHGFEEHQTPLLVRDHTLFGSGQLPKFYDDQFVAYSMPNFLEAFRQSAWAHRESLLGHVEKHGLAAARDLELVAEGVRNDPNFRHWLVPTSEVTLANLVRESVLQDVDLPKRFAALTPCFRAEAGAAGKDTRGMLRQHQFNKVEMVAVTRPQDADAEQERMLECAEDVLKRLGLHYRVVRLCAGDMGATMQRTFDIEVWLPGQGAYREISSVSTAGDWQARRMSARYRTAGGELEFVHTLNGSGVAVGRALIAVMETYQRADGAIAIPEVLRPHMGGIEQIGPPR